MKLIFEYDGKHYTITHIADHAFYGCSSITSLTLPDSLIEIGHYSFAGCTGITSLVIPKNVTSICKYAFENCSNLTSITFADTTTWYHSFDKGATTTQLNVALSASKNADYLTNSIRGKYWTKK